MMKHLAAVLLLLILATPAEGASTVQDIHVKGHILYGPSPTPDGILYNAGTHDITGPADIIAATDLVAGRHLIVNATSVLADALYFAGQINAASRILRLIITPTETPAGPTNTPTNTPTATNTPTGTYSTPTPTATWIEPLWIEGNGNIHTAGSVIAGATIAGATITGATIATTGDLTVGGNLTVTGTISASGDVHDQGNLYIGEPTPIYVSPDGDDAIVKGSLEGQAGLELIGDLEIHGTPTPNIPLTGLGSAYAPGGLGTGGDLRAAGSGMIEGDFHGQDNVYIGEPTPEKITPDGDDLVVKGSLEGQAGGHIIGELRAWGNLVHDDDSGHSPWDRYIDGANHYTDIYQHFDSGYLWVDSDQAGKGMLVRDNLIIGDQPTPIKISINGGDLVVAGDTELQTGAEVLGRLRLWGTPTPIASIGTDGDLWAADDATVNDDLNLGGTLYIYDTLGETVLMYKNDADNLIIDNNSTASGLTIAVPLNGTSTLTVAGNTDLAGQLEVGDSGDYLDEILPPYVFTDRDTGAGSGLQWRFSTTVALPMNVAAAAEGVYGIPARAGEQIYSITLWYNYGSTDTDNYITLSLKKVQLSDAALTTVATNTFYNPGSSGSGSFSITPNYTVESGYALYVHVILYVDTGGSTSDTQFRGLVLRRYTRKL